MQPILIASLVAILVIGAYLALNKSKSKSRLKNPEGSVAARFSKEPYTGDLWLWTGAGGTPCGRFLGKYYVTQGADGKTTGYSEDGNKVEFGSYPYVVDSKIVNKDTIHISGGTYGYTLKAPNVLSFTGEWYGPMLFQPASNLPKECIPTPVTKILQTAWNYPGSPYAPGVYPPIGQNRMTNREYQTCLAKVPQSFGAAAEDFCQSRCQSYCINNGLGTVQACGGMCF